MFAYPFVWSLGHATDDYLFSDCQPFPLGNSFCPRLSKFPSSSIQFQCLWIVQTIPPPDSHWWGRAWQQWSIAASDKASCFRSLLLTSHNFGCSHPFALKPRNPSTNPEHSCYPRCRQGKHKGLWITRPLRNPRNRAPASRSSALFSLFKQPECEGITRVHNQNINISHCPDSQWVHQVTE